MRVMGETSLVEHEAVYPDDDDFVQRSVTLLVPCSYSFGQPQARGFMLLDHIGYHRAAGHLRECLCAATPAATTETFTDTVLGRLRRRLRSSG